MIKQVKIYDMDGVLVDSLHRYRAVNGRIDLNYWLENEHLAYNDSLLPMAKEYRKDLKNPSTYVVIATARVLNSPDWAFINDKLGIPNKVISRKGRADTRKGAELKIQGLRYIKNLKQFRGAEIVFFEDNTDYLKPVCDFLNCKGVYIPSKQGH